MGFFKKIGGFVSKGVGAVGKLTRWSGKLMTNPIGAIAEAAQGVKLVKEEKQEAVTSSQDVGTPNLKQQSSSRSGQMSGTTGGGGIKAWFAKMWEWVKKNKQTIIIVAVVGVVGLLVYFFIFAKKGARRKSPRRVNQAARMRAARAAKRRK